MTATPTADQVFRFHIASGLPVVKAREFVIQQPTELCERILRAAAQQGHEACLCDPLEDDPAFGPIIAAALKRADSEVPNDAGPGRYHGIWAIAQRILRDGHGITWFSPREMNPGRCFD